MLEGTHTESAQSMPDQMAAKFSMPVVPVSWQAKMGVWQFLEAAGPSLNDKDEARS